MSHKTDKQKKQSQTRKATAQRRKTQVCRVYELKLIPTRLRKKAKAALKRLFLEAKWFRNAVIASTDPFAFDDKTKSVLVKVGSSFESRELKHLSSQMKQGLLKQVQDDIVGLHAKKQKGYKVGGLKFKSFVGSLPLKQHGNTYTLERKHKNNGCLTLQKQKHRFRVRGMKQIPEGAEFANAKLLKRGDDYVLHVTCFLDKKEVQKQRSEKRKELGIEEPLFGLGVDLGIASQVTLSNGLKVHYKVPIGKSIKKRAKRVSRCQKGSNNRRKARVALQKAYRKTTNVKREITNQLLSCLSLFCMVICVQDDSIKGWQHIWGRIILETSVGGLLGKLKELPGSIEVSKWEATSQTCRLCGAKTKHGLSERRFECGVCKHREERDVHAAKNILRVGLAQLLCKSTVSREKEVQVERLEPAHETPVDMRTSAKMCQKLQSIEHIRVSRVDETGSWACEKL